ncbi:LPS export ABC transporter periplasmic protein LptC [bacterium]|nr:LPS export ABC transporter periplasmic protein LptC [bacterium]
MNRTLALLLLLPLLLTAACEKQQPDAQTASTVPSPPAFPEDESDLRHWLRMDSVMVFLYEGETLKAELKSRSATVDIENEVTILNRVTASLHEKGKKSATIYARKGRLHLADRPRDNIQRNDIDLYGGVDVEMAQGGTIRTPRLHYSNQQDSIRSAGGPFTKRLPVEGGFMVGTGGWFTATPDFRHFTEYNNVQWKFVSLYPSSPTPVPSQPSQDTRE